MSNIFSPYLKAQRLFAISTALSMIPPPAPNQTVEDLNRHVRSVVFQNEIERSFNRERKTA
jgi:hypothetical protein